MLFTLAALLAPAPQVKSPTYTEAPTQIYQSTPVFVADSSPAPDLTIHSVTVQLGADESKVDTLTLWHNDGTDLAKGKLTFLVASNGYGFSALKNFKATWNKTPIEFKVEKVDRLPGMAGDILIAPRELMTVTAPVALPAKGTGSLTMSYTQPTTKYGLDKAARQWVYSFLPLSNTPEQFRLALKFSPDVVWKPIQSLSSVGKWEVGPNGAYLKLDGTAQPKPGQAIFRFYPTTN